MSRERERVSRFLHVALTAAIAAIPMRWAPGSDGPASPAATESSAHPAPPPGAAATSPRGFIENAGQWPESVRFAARADGIVAGFEDHRMLLRLAPMGGPSHAAGRTVALSFEGASAETVVEGREAEGTTYRFARRWGSRTARSPGVEERAQRRAQAADRAVLSRAASYSTIAYRGLYPGVDLRVRASPAGGRGSRIEHDFLVAPGAAVNGIVIRADGFDAVCIEETGDLLLCAGPETIRQPRPLAWHAIGSGEIRPVSCRFRDLGDLRYGFEVPERDDALPLVIDPLIERATYLGGSGEDCAFDVAVDPAGGVVVAGFTSSLEPPSAEEIGVGEYLGGRYDAFVARFDAELRELLSLTFLGGSGDDRALDVAVTRKGEVVVAGRTDSADLLVEGGVQAEYGGGVSDGFLVVLSPAGEGEEILYSTYLGGAGEDSISAIAVDELDRVVAVGYSSSPDFGSWPGLPAPSNPYQATNRGQEDAIVLRLMPTPGAPAEEQVEYATFLGGSGRDVHPDLWDSDRIYVRMTNPVVALEDGGTIIVAGRTDSRDFPVTAGALQPASAGGFDGFVSRLDLDSGAGGPEQLRYSSYLGGGVTWNDAIQGVALDPSGDVWVTGFTWSSGFPVTPGALQTALGGGDDVILTRLRLDDPPRMVYSTLLGGAGSDFATDLLVAADGAVTVVGYAGSDPFPAAGWPGGGGFVTCVEPAGEGDPGYAIRGSIASRAIQGDVNAIAAGAPGRFYVVGFSYTGGLPSTDGAYQEQLAGICDSVVLRLDARYPRARISADPAAGGTPIRSWLDGSSSTTPEGTEITSYLWEIDGVETASEARVERTFDTPGPHVVRLTVTNSVPLSASAEKTVVASCPSGDVSPWTAVDIGEPAFPGSSRWDGEAMALCAGGRGISSAGDELHMAYQERDGDFVLTARLADLSGGNPLAGAGLMVRGSFEDEAAFVALLAERRFADDPPTALNLRARYRVATDAIPSSKALGTIEDYGTGPLWLRLRRTGRTVSAFISRSPEGTFAETPDHEMDLSSGPMLAALAAFGREGTDAARPFRALEARFEDVDLSDPAVSGPEFIRGDANSDGSVDISDGISTLGYLFLGGPAPSCLDAADADDSAGTAASDGVNITDAVYVLNHLFLGGPAPPPPYPDCGEDPTEDLLDCAASSDC